MGGLHTHAQRDEGQTVMVNDPGLNPGSWVYLIIIIVVLFALVAGLYQTFFTNVSDLGNATGNPFGDAFATIILLLLFAALLLAVVGAFLGRAKMKGA